MCIAPRLLLILMLAAVPLAIAAPDQRASRDVVAVNELLVLDSSWSQAYRRSIMLCDRPTLLLFGLDASHVPHSSVLQACVQSKDHRHLCCRAYGKPEASSGRAAARREGL